MDALQEAPIDVDDGEFTDLATLIRAHCGISLGEGKRELLKARLMRRVRAHGFTRYRDYLDYVARDHSGRELDEMIEAVATNVTSFFREKAHFDFLSNKILPALLARKSKTGMRRLRAWSCATASGEETYSLLIVLLEALKAAPDWDVKILGTDISKKVLRQAIAGEYDAVKVAAVPAPLRGRYFDEGLGPDGARCAVKAAVKALAHFYQFNLMTPAFPFHKKFDVIFCRNVLIYFDKPTQEALVRRLATCLVDGGALFLGHSESIIGMNVPLTSVTTSVYRKTA
jgi:chemotaxis protein methyltransferase CheR